MDIPRKQRRIRRTLLKLTVVLVLASGAVIAWRYVNSLEPAVPAVDRRQVLLGTVQRGDMVREVRGIGELVPEDEFWISADTGGRVKKKFLEAGEPVQPDTVLLELTNTTLELEALSAESELKSAEASLAGRKVDSQRAQLEMSAGLDRLQSDCEAKELRVAANEELFKERLISELEMKLSRVELQAIRKRIKTEKERLAKYCEGEEAELAVLSERVEQARNRHEFVLRQVDALRVRAGIAGVLEQFATGVDEGKHVTTGAVLAKVSDPTCLKAALRVSESQVREVEKGMPVLLEVLKTDVPGKVLRVDPTVVDGNVTVEVVVEADLPRGARPELSATGTIEIEALSDILYVDKPVFARADSQVRLFMVEEDGTRAHQTTVDFGRSSVSTIEILSGLSLGDEIILSDTKRWSEHARIELE